MKKLPKILRPKYINDLIRLGDNMDGGYVLNNQMAEDCKNLISLGLGDNFSFEKELKKKNSKIKIVVYDHSINLFFWIKHFFNWLWHSIRFRKLSLKFLSFVDYIIFFKIKKNIHNKIKISKNYSISQIIEKYQIKPEETIVKIDIEGAEYQILDELIIYDFLGLLIEFHYLDKNLNKVLDFVSRNKKLSIIHLHANNFDRDHEISIPRFLEVSFLNSKLINNFNENKRSYPIRGLDYPNNPLKDDIKLFFED